MALYKFYEHVPFVGESVYVADTADVIGNVTLYENSSIWYNAVLRGDTEILEIGKDSNIQDGAVLHADPGFPLKVGQGVTVGHQAMLHGCVVGDGSLIGIQAVVLNGAKIGKNSLVAAGAVVKEGAEFPDNVLIVGAPARVVRVLSEDQIKNLHANSERYVERGKQHAENVIKID